MEKIVYVGMVGDMLHAGHINVINTAAKLGKVVVGVLTDEAVVGYKRLPFLGFEERSRVVKSILGVERVVAQNTLSYAENLRTLKPDYVVHGDDWKYGDRVSQTRAEVIHVLSEWGGELVEVPYTKGISSTLLHQANEEEGIIARNRQGRLRRLLAANKTLRIIEAHSALASLIVSEARSDDSRLSFDALWQSSLTDSALRGKPDCEIIDKSHRIRTIEEIFDCTFLPMIYDGDSGGSPDHVYALARALDKVGVSAVCFEDKVGMKRNSLYGATKGQKQASISEFIEKIQAFKSACMGSEMMHVSRIESLVLDQGMGDAVDRALAYTDAGSDAILIHSIKKTSDEVCEFAKTFRDRGVMVPIFVVPTTYWKTPFAEFEAHGINGVIYANQLLRAVVRPIERVATSILNEGLCDERAFENEIISTSQLLKYIPEYV